MKTKVIALASLVLTPTLVVAATISEFEKFAAEISDSTYQLTTSTSVQLKFGDNSSETQQFGYSFNLRDPGDVIYFGTAKGSYALTGSGSIGPAANGATSSNFLSTRLVVGGSPQLNSTSRNAGCSEENGCPLESGTIFVAQLSNDVTSQSGFPTTGTFSLTGSHRSSGSYPVSGTIELTGDVSLTATVRSETEMKDAWREYANNIGDAKDAFDPSKSGGGIADIGGLEDLLEKRAAEHRRETLGRTLSNLGRVGELAVRVTEDVAEEVANFFDKGPNPTTREKRLAAAMLALRVSASVSQTLMEAWAEDPPNMNFRQEIVVPDRTALSSLFDFEADFEKSAYGATQALLDASILGSFALDAFEAYQGAYISYLTSGDPEDLAWAERHLKVAEELIRQSEELREMATEELRATSFFLDPESKEADYVLGLASTFDAIDGRESDGGGEGPVTPSPTEVPLPASLPLLLCGLLLLGRTSRKRLA